MIMKHSATDRHDCPTAIRAGTKAEGINQLTLQRRVRCKVDKTQRTSAQGHPNSYLLEEELARRTTTVRAFESVSTWQQPVPVPISIQRTDLITHIARKIAAQSPSRLRVAVDGVTGAGKTSFGHELAAALRNEGRSTARACLDDFKHPWRHSHQQNYDRSSGYGYYHNAYDLDSIRSILLEPAGQHSAGLVALCAHDPLTGADNRQERQQLLDDTVLVVDSIFAARPELEDMWDIHLWLQVDADVALQRAVQRDVDREGYKESLNLHLHRYGPALEEYRVAVDVYSRADLIVENTKLDQIRLLSDRLPLR